MANPHCNKSVVRKLAEIRTKATTRLTPIETRDIAPLIEQADEGLIAFTNREATIVQAVHARVCPDSELCTCFPADDNGLAKGGPIDNKRIERRKDTVETPPAPAPDPAVDPRHVANATAGVHTEQGTEHEPPKPRADASRPGKRKKKSTASKPPGARGAGAGAGRGPQAVPPGGPDQVA